MSGASRQRGSNFGARGVYTCAECGKSTRATPDNDNEELCKLCYTKAVCENNLSDNTNHPAPFNDPFNDCLTVNAVHKRFNALVLEYGMKP